MTVKVYFQGTQAEIEAMANVPAGASAYATDTATFGTYNGSWAWEAGHSHDDIWTVLNDVVEVAGNRQPGHDTLTNLTTMDINSDGVVVIENQQFARKTYAEFAALLQPHL